MLKDRCAIVQAGADPEGQPHHQDHIRIFESLRDLQNAPGGILQKKRLEKQVSAGVPGNAEFGKESQRRAFLFRLFPASNDLFGIERNVRDLYGGTNGCDSVKSVHIPRAPCFYTLFAAEPPLDFRKGDIQHRRPSVGTGKRLFAAGELMKQRFALFP